MATTDAWARHYGHLKGEERFRLQIEALAREDLVEQGRLTDSCPVVTVRCEDPEFRRRMHISFNAAALAAFDIRLGLAKIRLAHDFARDSGIFARRPVLLAEAAFLCGRAHGHWEAGAAGDLVMPSPQDLAEQVKACPFLGEQLRELHQVALEEVEKLTELMLELTGQAFAEDVLTTWDGFGLFCRGTLNLEPMTLMRAWRLMDQNPAEQVLAIFEDVAPREKDAREYGERMARTWRGRFGGG